MRQTDSVQWHSEEPRAAVLTRAMTACRRAAAYVVGPVVWAFLLVLMLQGLWTGAWYGYAFALIFGHFALWILILTRRARKQGAAQLAEAFPDAPDIAAQVRHPPMSLPWRLVVGGTAVLLAVQLVSLAQRSPAWPPGPPPTAGARWQWFDRCVRFERWHAPKVVPGPYAGADTPAPGHPVLAIGRGVTGGIASRPNGALVVRTFDFCQLNFLQAALFFLFAGGTLAILWEVARLTRSAVRCRRAAAATPRTP